MTTLEEDQRAWDIERQKPAYHLAELYPFECTRYWNARDLAEEFTLSLCPEKRCLLTAGERVEVRNFFAGLIEQLIRRALNATALV